MQIFVILKTLKYSTGTLILELCKNMSMMSYTKCSFICRMYILIPGYLPGAQGSNRDDTLLCCLEFLDASNNLLINILIWFITICAVSVAAMKRSSKFHAKVSRNFWHESLNLFDETFPWKFRQNFALNLANISHTLHKIEHTEVKIA